MKFAFCRVVQVNPQHPQDGEPMGMTFLNPFEWELNEHTASEEQEPDVVASQRAQLDDKVAGIRSSFVRVDLIGSGPGRLGELFWIFSSVHLNSF